MRRAYAELVLAELLELAPSGVEEVELDHDVVEYAVYGARGELPELPDLRAAAGKALVEVASTEVDDDWQERWREFHKPLILGSDLAVRPPWEPAQGTEIDIVIDPGRAFGTGGHPTTRLCLELMLELEPRSSFVDVGCGSGVLAIAAARLGWHPVLALDNDVASLEAAHRNAARNSVAIDIERFDVRKSPVPSAEVIAANLLTPLLLTLAQRLTHPPRRLILSGLLAGEADQVAEAFDLTEVRRLSSGEWAALLMDKG